MKVCVIGNSHLASFKLGWDVIASQFPSVSPSFFGSPAGGLSRLKLKGATLVPRGEKLKRDLEFTSGGLSSIDISAYDAFVIVGAQAGLLRMLQFNQRHRTANWLGVSKYESLLSEVCFQEAARGALRGRRAISIIRMLRSVTDRPVLLSVEPFFSLTVKPKSQFWREDAVSALHRVRPIYEAEMDALRSELGFTLIDQPAETVVEECFTAPEFGSGSIKLLEGLATAHSDGEHRHMNSKYGALVARDAVRQLFSITAPGLARLAAVVEAPSLMTRLRERAIVGHFIGR